MMATGGPGWIAGIVYTTNALRALQLTPEAVRPEIDLLVGPRDQREHHDELLPYVRRVHSYGFRRDMPPHRQLGSASLAVVRGHRSRSLEKTVLAAGSTCVFPVRAPLGARFPISWLGWIPDFQHRHLPRFFSPRQCIARDELFGAIANQASAVVVSSNSARDDLLRWYEVDVERIRVLRFRSMAAPEWYRRDPRAVAQRLGLPEKFLIFPSQFWAHKNHTVLFESLAILAARGLDVHLVCTGATGDFRNADHFSWLESRMAELGIEDRIHILGLLPRLEQIQLMRTATAVVQPSLFEGWSALLEDARTLGKRVFVSEIPVHREQDPTAARFFPPDDPEALADQLADDWLHLEPGPDMVAETRAHAAHLELGRNYGGELIEAMDAAYAAWSSR